MQGLVEKIISDIRRRTALNSPSAVLNEVMPFPSVIKNAEYLDFFWCFINKEKCDVVLDE